MSWMKFGMIAACTGLWLSGLADQFHSVAAILKYILISGALVATTRA